MSGKLIQRVALVLGTIFISLVPFTGTASAAPSQYNAYNIAHTKIGDPYSWGGTGPSSFDCSGLVYYSYRHAGFSVSRTAQEQYDQAYYVSYYHRVVGDLVFIGDSSGIFHVGIYAGVFNGRSYMLHAPHTGAQVRLEPIYENWDRYDTISYGRI